MDGYYSTGILQGGQIPLGLERRNRTVPCGNDRLLEIRTRAVAGGEDARDRGLRLVDDDMSRLIQGDAVGQEGRLRLAGRDEEEPVGGDGPRGLQRHAGERRVVAVERGDFVRGEDGDHLGAAAREVGLGVIVAGPVPTTMTRLSL